MSGSDPAVDFETLWKTLEGANTQTLGALGGLTSTIRPSTLASARAALARREGAALSDRTLPRLPLIPLAGADDVDPQSSSLRAPSGPRALDGPESTRAGAPDAHDAPDATGAPDATIDLEVTGLLGEGGMGRVLAARQHSLGREVAVKMLRPEAMGVEAAHALLVEGLVTGFLEHPSIIPIHALGRDLTGRPLLVMKRIEGVAWRALLEAPAHPAWATVEGGQDPDRLPAHLAVLMAAATALHFAHSRGVVHRDLKPDNVMIGAFGEVYVVDWGIALRVESGAPTDVAALGIPSRSELAGTPAYMAPEMVHGGRPIDARTDVYLLGATLHEVLTGQRRHGGATLYAVLRDAHVSAPVAYADTVPVELAAIANRATSADPSARHPSAHAFRQAIADFLRNRGAIQLARDAAERLAAAAALAPRAAAGAGAAGDGARLGKLLTEARFGFTQALRAWPEGAEARAGLRACLILMIEVELSHRNASGARDLLPELSDPPPELLARIAAAEADLRLAAEREQRLVQLEHDMDLRVGSTPRLVAVASILALVLAMTVWYYRDGLRVPTPGVSIAFVVAPFLAVVVGTALARRQLLANAINRQLVWLVLVSLGTAIVHRVLGVLAGMSVPHMLLGDSLVTAALLACAAVVIDRRLARPIPIALCCALATIIYPAYAPLVFTIGAVAIFIAAGALLVRTGPSARPSVTPPPGLDRSS